MKKGLFVFTVIVVAVTVMQIEFNPQPSLTSPTHAAQSNGKSVNSDIETFIFSNESNPYRQKVLVEYAKALRLFINSPIDDAKALAKNMAQLQGIVMCAKPFQPSLKKTKAKLLSDLPDPNRYDEVLQAFTNGPYAYRILNRHCPIAKDGTEATPPASGYTVEDEMRAAEAGLPAGMYLPGEQ